MKKKLISLVLAMAMVGSLIGCGSGPDGSSTAESDSAPAETSADVEKEDTQEADGAGSEEAAQPAEGFVAAENPDDWPVITVQVATLSTMPDEQLVEDAINEYLVSINAGVKVDAIQTIFGDIATQLTLMLSDNQNPLDLFCWRVYSTVDGCVKNEQCISLDPYLDVYPDLWESYPEKVLKTQQLNGVQYAVPAVDSYATFETYMLRKDVAEELGIADRDGERITLEEMTQIMKDAKEIHPEYAYMINTNNELVLDIDTFGNPNWLGVLLNRGVDNREIVNLYETDEWRDYCYLMKDWKESGLMLDDPLNNELTFTQYNNAVSAGCYMGGYSVDYIRAMNASSPYEAVFLPLTDLSGTTASVLGGWMISSVCKNPDAAMKLLYLMATDETLARFFILGVEGHNYTVAENGTARYPDGIDTTNQTWQSNAPWFYPNQCLSLPLQTDMTTYYTDMLDAPNHAKFSEAMGFIFDSAPVYDQMAACTSVVAEYRNALLYGLVDVDSYLEEFNAELKAAGIDEIIAEEQKQFDAWLAEQ